MLTSTTLLSPLPQALNLSLLHTFRFPVCVRSSAWYAEKSSVSSSRVNLTESVPRGTEIVIVWSSDKLRARGKGDNKVVDVSIRADKLTAQGYELLLKGMAADNKSEGERSYSFRVVKP